MPSLNLSLGSRRRERERMLPGWLHHRRARLSFLSSSEIIIHLYMQLKGPGLNDAGRIMHVKCLNRAVDLALHFWTLPHPLKPYRWHAQEGRQAGLESVWHISRLEISMSICSMIFMSRSTCQWEMEWVWSSVWHPVMSWWSEIRKMIWISFLWSKLGADEKATGISSSPFISYTCMWKIRNIYNTPEIAEFK